MIKMCAIAVNGNILECPVCGEDYLHQGDVAVFNRTEDATFGATTFVPIDGPVKQSKFLNGNPSPRRHGMAVSFSCENCETNLNLLIYQHKGQTITQWECQEPTSTQAASKAP